MLDFNESAELERYLSGEMSPEETRRFTTAIEQNPELRSIVEADQMLCRVIGAELRSRPRPSSASRARIAQTARSAPRYAPPETKSSDTNSLSTWVSAMIVLGLFAMVAFIIIGGNGAEISKPSVGTGPRRVDTLQRIATRPDTRRRESSPTASLPLIGRSTARHGEEKNSSSVPGELHRSTYADSTRRAIDRAIIDTASMAPRGARGDSAHVPLTISPVRINRPTEPDGKP